MIDYDYNPQLKLNPAAKAEDSDLARIALAYMMPPDLELALNVAYVTRRPLLIRGEPGVGKSMAAAHVAVTMGWRYYPHVVTSRSEAQDLLYKFDHLRRLQDAQDPDVKVDPTGSKYVVPGPLWWAINSKSASSLGEAKREDPALLNKDSDSGSVLLLDEIDKADPDYPNSLLVPLDELRFAVPELGNCEIKPGNGDAELLVVITTNEERELPPAFLRRCVVHTIKPPEEKQLVSIANLHAKEGRLSADNNGLFAAIAKKLMDARGSVPTGGKPPSTAEYLDAIRACQQLGIGPQNTEDWSSVESLVLRKWTEKD